MENCHLRWVASGAMLADCLTKSMDSSKLRECLRTGQYSLVDEQMVLKQRSDRRQRLSWVRQQNSQPEDKKESETCLQSSHEPGNFWKLDREKGWLDRVHRNPRWVRFTPTRVMGCPVRATHAVFASGKKSLLTDIWVRENGHVAEKPGLDSQGSLKTN